MNNCIQSQAHWFHCQRASGYCPCIIQWSFLWFTTYSVLYESWWTLELDSFAEACNCKMVIPVYIGVKSKYKFMSGCVSFTGCSLLSCREMRRLFGIICHINILDFLPKRSCQIFYLFSILSGLALITVVLERSTFF